MAAAGIGNPVGGQNSVLFDWGVPKTLTGRARAETVSGGVFVFGSTAASVVSSGADTYVNADILWVRDASGIQCNGMALYSAGSNQPLAVLLEGVILAVANGNIVAGNPVMLDGNNAFAATGSTSVLIHAGGALTVGRALTEATSGNYFICHFKA